MKTSSVSRINISNLGTWTFWFKCECASVCVYQGLSDSISHLATVEIIGT